MIAQKNFWLAVVITTGLLACKKEQFGKTGDNKPGVPVTVTNAMAYRPEPTVSTSKSGGGAIQIILSIPAESGRTIKEITKIAANTTYTQIQSSGSTGFYTAAPIPVNGLTATFNTTLAEYVVKGPGVIPATTNTELAKRFYFLLTLDDNSTIVTSSVRVLVLD
jgi:hypothetical protein